MSEQPDVTPDPSARPSAEATPGAPDDPGARPVDQDAPAVTQHVGQDGSTGRAEDEEPYDDAVGRAGAAGATGFAPTSRRP